MEQELLLIRKETDKGGRALILDVSVNNFECILINLDNATTEKEQINVLSNLFLLLKNFVTIQRNS